MNYRDILLAMSKSEPILARRESWPIGLGLRRHDKHGLQLEMYDQGILAGRKHFMPSWADQNALDWEYIREGKEATS